jgi:hypothetical protein
LAGAQNRQVQVQTTASDFLEMTRKVLAVGKLGPRDKSSVLSMLQGGMDASTLTEVFNFVAFPQSLNATSSSWARAISSRQSKTSTRRWWQQRRG